MNDMSKELSVPDSGPSVPDRRTRKSRLMRAAEDAGIPSPHVAELISDLARLTAAADSHSSGLDLASRLEKVASRLDSNRGRFSFKDIAGGEFDAVEDASKPFRESEALDRIEGNESDLFHTYAGLLMLRSKGLRDMEEIDEMLDLVRLQFVRRDRKLENAHYRLPKTIIPFHQVMRAAGIGRDQQRTKSAFFKAFVACCLKHGDGRLSFDELMDIANGKEDLFDDLAGGAETGSQGQVDEIAPTGESESVERLHERRSTASLTESDLVPAGQNPAADAPPPTSAVDPRVLEALEKLSSGFARAKSGDPFEIYEFVDAPAPFQHVPLREFPADRPAPTGEIDPLDLVRLEANDGIHKWQVMQGRSEVLGRLHPLMLPPHASAIWYGQQLGWGEVEMRELARFGNAGEPSKIDVDADPLKMLRALRGVVELQLRELARVEPSHLLADPAKASIAAEDLSLWWLYVLFCRHSAVAFMLTNKRGLFHGVEGPDVSMQDGKAIMGDSYIRMISIECAEAEQMDHVHLLEDRNGDDLRRRPVYHFEW